MKRLTLVVQRMTLIASLGWIAHQIEPASAQTNDPIRIVELRGTVEILPHGAATWVGTVTNQDLHPLDRVRTRANSSVGIRWSDQSVLRFPAWSEMEISPGSSEADQGFHPIQGIFSFFHRGQPSRIRVIASGGLAGIEGTEFVMAVGETNGVEQTTLSVIDGKVRFSNAGLALVLTNGDQAVGEPGQKPRRTPGFITKNILQWCFYYPGVLDLDELPLTSAEKTELGESLVAYRAGDLLAALAKYPDARQPGSDGERIYHAALLLAVGQVEPAEADLSALTATDTSARPQRLATALRTLIAAVKREPRPSTLNPQLSTELLAASYFEQSLAGPKALDKALELARRATTNSPNCGFARERVAELEFSFGRTERASADLKQALLLSPRNAQALALKGFLLAAQNKTRAAIEQFDRALAVDSALGNAWLGRGLCRIRRGDTQAGREDLLIAAAMEPQRAALRSYLGKAFGDAGDTSRARHELYLAKTLDTNDPTAWLYSALLNEQNNHINEAIRDLEKSKALNDNRSVYRSGLLLDQDRAVRSANLARIYDEAGMDDVALREAARAVSADYANYSAHLFLANSYQQLRASSPFDLRYETPAFSEYLIASLLGPADGRMLAQPVTQQEYTRLFDRDSFGISSGTEYLSRGAVSQYVAQYGTLRNSSYAFESDYNWDPGQTPNGSQESRQYSLKIKQMLTPDDGVFFQLAGFQQDSGDLSQRYDPHQADLGFKVSEKQEPSLLIGLDHRWSENQRTLFLAGIFNDSLSLEDANGPTYVLGRVMNDVPPYEFHPINLAEHFQNRLTIESFELQHLATFGQFQTIAGIRYQTGVYRLSDEQSLRHQNWLSLSLGDRFLFPDPPVNLDQQSFTADSQRVTPYLYEYWQVFSQLQFIGGLAYDYQSLPENALFAPLDNKIKIQRQLSPKAGVIWSPTDRTTLRGMYAQSLGGANLDQSLRLEPTQLAGFTQAYRSVMPDSLVGGIGGARFETADVSLEHRFGFGTYAAVSGELLHSTADQEVGAYDRQFLSGQGYPVSEPRVLSFQERALDLSVHQLLGDYFSVGVRYRYADARLVSDFSQLNARTRGSARTDQRGQLQLTSFDGTFQHPSGVFATVEGQWWRQQLAGDLGSLPGDDFWQVNVAVGYRSPRRHVEISLGLLNVTGQDYRLHPINLYPDLPRQGTLAAKLQLNF